VSFPLEYFDPSSDATWYAIFKQAYQVSTEVLDLCVLNSDGRCMIDLSAAVPTDFHHSWQQRCTELQSSYRSHASHVGKILSGIEKLDPDLVSRPYLDEALKAKLTRSMLDPQFDYEPCGVFRFGIRRCGRYRQPGATALLSQFVAFLSRNASEPDFVK
jgi:hypothetical protein